MAADAPLPAPPVQVRGMALVLSALVGARGACGTGQAGGVRSREGGHRTSGAARAPCTMISQAPAPRFGRSAGLVRPACLKHTWCGPALSRSCEDPLAWTDEATAGEAPTCPEAAYPINSLPGRCALREPTSRSPRSTQTSRADPSHRSPKQARTDPLTRAVLSHITTPRERAPPEQDTPTQAHHRLIVKR